jgi:hypothetical protein
MGRYADHYFPNVDILIEEDVITGIGPTGTIRAPDTAERFDPYRENWCGLSP